MLRKVILYTIVYDEIEEVIRNYENISEILEWKIELAIQEVLSALSEGANYYYNLDDGIHRRIPVAGFPYMFVYQIQADTVVVKILFPQKGDPARLIKRLE